MRVGIFGGSFDPVHNGHLLLAEFCRETAKLDEVWFVPTWVSPHKQDQPPASPQARCEMLELAIAGNARFHVNRIEVQRAVVSFTVDTLEALHRQHPEAKFSLLIGADSLVDLPRWRNPQRICEIASILVVARTGEPTPDLSVVDAIFGCISNSTREDKVVAMPLIELSSTEIRDRIRNGKSVRYQTPRAVEKYLETHSLYQTSPRET